MRSLLLLVCFVGASLLGCDATTSAKEAALDPLNDGQKTRLVSVSIRAQSDNGFAPDFASKIVVAEPMTLVPKVRAQGKAIVQNIDTIIVGSSCEQLRADHPELMSCEEVDAVDFKYAATESTATTDAVGVAALYLGGHEKYRISIQSFATTEDPHCFWGGSEILEQSASSLTIPLHVFCE